VERGRLQLFLLGSAGTVVFVAACADIFGVHSADVDGGAGDGGVQDAPYDYQVHDAIDLDVNTAVCDGGVALVADDQAVWVSGTGSDGASCGTRDAPCATITHALSVIGTRKVMYLDHATFTEALSLGANQAGFTIQGGFERATDGGWTPQCDNSLSTIQAPEDGGPSAIDVNGSTGITLRLLTIRSKANGAIGGESVYAMRVFNTTGVVLDNVTLLAQSGGPGLVGSTGTSTTTCTYGQSGNAGAGSTGAPGTPGSIGPSGYTPTFGGVGGDGGFGPSTPGSAGACNTCVTVCSP
jgi:hypothetical protein